MKKLKYLLYFISFVGSSLAFAEQMHYDVLHQNIVVDTRQEEITLQNTIKLKVLSTGDQFSFIRTGLNIESVSINGEFISPLVQEEGFISTVALHKLINANEEIEITLVHKGRYNCPISPNGSVTCIHTANMLMLQPTNSQTAWYVTNPFLEDFFVGTIKVLMKNGQIAATGQNEAIEKKQIDTDNQSWLFNIEHPITSFAIFVADGSMIRSENQSVVAYLTDQGDTKIKAAKKAVDFGEKVIKYYSEYLGKSINFASVSFVPPKMEFGGLGLLGNVYIGAWILEDYANFMLEQGVAHEFAHTWFGGFSRPSLDQSNYAGPWFTEGFAEYMAWKAMGSIKNESERDSGMRMNAIWYMLGRPTDDDVAIDSQELIRSPYYVYAAYHKGSILLRNLEDLIGEEKMQKILRTIIADGAGNLTLERLSQIVRVEAHIDLTMWMNTWLKSSGYPYLLVDSNLDVQKKSVILAISVTKDHEKSFENGFSWEVPIKFTFKDGSVRFEKMQLGLGNNQRNYQFDLAIRSIEIDPHWTAPRMILRKKPHDVNLDGEVTNEDVKFINSYLGGKMPTIRRFDGRFDPAFDLDQDLDVDQDDVALINSIN